MAQKVSEVMTRGVEVIRPDDTIKQAAVKMEVLNVGVLPVCDGERLQGMVTDRDIAVRAVASGKDPTSTSVRGIMTTELVYCFEDQPLDEVVELMKKKQIRRLPVLSREKRLVGMLALGDLAVHGDGDRSKDALERISQPAQPDRP